jgi:Tol biopolymer transport system component
MNPEQYLDALLSLPGMVNPQVSPNKKWVAWTWFRTGPAADVYAAPVDCSSAPIRLTETPENSFIVNWMPDSSAVFFVQDENGNERDQLFRVDLDLVLVPLTSIIHPSFAM